MSQRIQPSRKSPLPKDPAHFVSLTKAGINLPNANNQLGAYPPIELVMKKVLLVSSPLTARQDLVHVEPVELMLPGMALFTSLF